MSLRVLAVALSLVMATQPSLLQSQTTDADLAHGIRQAQEGDFDHAVISLDIVARRLEAQGGPTPDLARAHVYLAVVHLGLGRQADAHAHAEQALHLDPALQVTTHDFPPRVVHLFDEVRRTAASQQLESRPSATTSGSTARPTTAPPPRAVKATPPGPRAASANSAAQPKEGGGSGRIVLIGLGLGAAGGGIALAAGGGGEGGSATATPAPIPTPTPASRAPVVLLQTGWQMPIYQARDFDVTSPGSGTLRATVDWARASDRVSLYIYNGSHTEMLAFVHNAKPEIIDGLRVSAGGYVIQVHYRGDSPTQSGTLEVVWTPS